MDNFYRRHSRIGKPWFFHHIPKTAGSSLVQELAFCVRPYFNIHSKFSAEGEIADTLDKSYEEFLRTNEHTLYRSASGHLRYEQAQRLRADIPNVRMFTFLRNPVERVVSDYRYTRSAAHPGNHHYRSMYESLPAYIGAPANQNRMWKFVAGPTTRCNTEAIQAVIRKYTFIGLVEEFDLCLQFLTAMWGCPKSPNGFQNRTVSEEVIPLTGTLVQEIASHNAADRTLYKIAERRIQENAQAMRAFIAERRASYAIEATRNTEE